MPFATVCGGVRVTTWPPPVPGVSVSVVSDILGAEEKRRSRARKVGGDGQWLVEAKLLRYETFPVHTASGQFDTAETAKPKYLSTPKTACIRIWVRSLPGIDAIDFRSPRNSAAVYFMATAIRPSHASRVSRRTLYVLPSM